MRKVDRVGGVVRSKPAVQESQVRANRARCDPKAARYLLVGQTQRNEIEHGELLWRQVADAYRRAAIAFHCARAASAAAAGFWRRALVMLLTSATIASALGSTGAGGAGGSFTCC